MKTHVGLRAVLSLAAIALPCTLHAQAFPAKPIRVLVGFTPGAGVDIAVRLIGPKMTDTLGQQIIVDNRPGAGGNVAAEQAARAPADGYTLLANGAPAAISQTLYAKLGYDLLRDFEAVALIASVSQLLVVHPSLPAKTLKELLDHARARPGRLSYGSVGNGTSFHLGMEQLKKLSGTFIVHIPYKGMGPVLNDLLANTVQLAFANPPNAAPMIAAGRLRAVALAHSTRIGLLPEVPTVAEQGYPGFESNSGFMFFAPAGTPAPVLDRLHAEFTAILREPSLREPFSRQGIEVVAASRAETAAFLRREIAKYADVVKFSGATVD